MTTAAAVANLLTAAILGTAISYAVWRKLADGRVDWHGVIMIGLGGLVLGLAGPCF
jgi:hypothetical protein